MGMCPQRGPSEGRTPNENHGGLSHLLQSAVWARTALPREHGQSRGATRASPERDGRQALGGGGGGRHRVGTSQDLAWG